MKIRIIILLSGVSWVIAARGDSLHGCFVGTTCFDNGKVTPTTINPLPTFTFTDSSGPATGDLLVEILVPDNVANAASLSFAISESLGGPNNTSTIGPTSAILEGHWTSGNLAWFLGLSGASPNNPIGAWLPYTTGKHCGSNQHGSCAPGAGGYDVYQVDLGTNQLLSPSSPTKPILTLSGPLPEASVIVAYLSQNEHWTATANSGALFEAGKTTSIPESSSLAVHGLAVMGAAFFSVLRRNARKAKPPEQDV